MKMRGKWLWPATMLAAVALWRLDSWVMLLYYLTR